MIGESGAVSCVANTPKTILVLTAPSNQALAVKRVTVSFEGVTSTDKPAVIEFGTNSAGTTGAVTERQTAGPTISSIQGVLTTYSAEGTFTAYSGVYCHLQSGYEKVFQLAEDEWVVAPSGTFGIRVTNPTGNSTTNCRCTIEWEE